ncbi:MAG: response regulator [Rhizobiales bacterium]|nr:response regulator [Hyphomicrobiales bacterium]
MNGVLGMAELLLAGDDLAASHRRRIEVIKRSGHTVLTMLESMLDLARLDVCEADAEASSFDFRQLVRKVIGEIERKEAGRAQQFQLVDSSEQYRLHLGNVARIQKLLAHFLEIARGHSAEEPVTIATSTDFTRSGNPQLRLEAEIVCPPNDALGQRFSSSLQAPSITSSKVDEAVVTLILCRKLAAMLGGEIGLERHAEGRSTLWLTIHAHTHQEDYPRSPARNPSERLASSAEMPRTPPRILEVLVAEDDLDMAMLIQDLLEEAGHRATMVHDGTSVLQLLDQKHFDVVLLDGRMPDMSGLETAERIRQLPKIGADIPIIALTGEVLAGDRERYLSAGMDAYVPKPVNYHTLISTIHQCCNH